MPLKPFDENAACPKCGAQADEISTTYAEGACIPENGYGCGQQGEHIHRTCDRCGYDWAEACLDGELPPAPPSDLERLCDQIGADAIAEALHWRGR